MDLTLSPEQAELRARARAFAIDVLQPHEAAFERDHGLPDSAIRVIKQAAIQARLHGGSLPVAVGGQGWTALEQVLVHEQLGQVTGGLWGFIPGAYNALVHCSPEQRRRYLDPSLRGERNGSYAITEPGQGSDARTLASTAVRDPATGEYVLNGEKWYVTGAPDTDFMIFHCHVLEPGGERRPTLFLVDYDTPGVELTADPDYTHTFADRHPQFVLTDVRLPAEAVLGGVGEADVLSNEWFVEERLHIGARCSGAMERLLTLAVEWATGRIQFDQRIYDFQGVSFPLADSAADASAARLLTREAAWMLDAGADAKVVHARASVAKLFASEAAWRCADRVVQVFGGRGYMREYPAERYLRELRVDRIWEGTSEIQRVVIARALEKRGVDAVVG